MFGKERLITAAITFGIALGVGHLMQSGISQTETLSADRAGSTYTPLPVRYDSRLSPGGGAETAD